MKMGVLDKFLTFMKVNEEEGDEEFYDDDYLDEEEPAPRRSSATSSKARDTYDYEEERVETLPLRKSSGKITSIRSGTRKLANDLEVCVIKPTSVEDAEEIAKTLLRNHTVLLNLEGLEENTAQRIFDITIGVSIAIAGNLQSISKYIFIVTPENVNLSGDFSEMFGGVSEMPFRK